MKAQLYNNRSFLSALGLMCVLLLITMILTACTPEAQAKSAVNALKSAVNALYNKDKDGMDITKDLTAKDDVRFEAAIQAVDQVQDEDQKKELTGKIAQAQKMVDVQTKANGLYKEADGKTLMADNAKQETLDTVKKDIKTLSDAGMTAFAERATAAIADADGYLACQKKVNSLYADETRKQITNVATTTGAYEAKKLADKIGNTDIKKQATDLAEKTKKDIAARNDQVVAAGGSVDASGAITASAPEVTASAGSDYSSGGSGYENSGSGYSCGYDYSSGGGDYYSSGESESSSSGNYDSGSSGYFTDNEDGRSWETGGTFDWPEGW
ncbi:hypothetical protein [Eubacterium aggregans]|uniref:hypothetical protein n=1 Tax=Eubacterium aggregans TaxID=81409 RepID=UPI003F3ABB97